MDKAVLNDMDMIFVVEGINQKNNGITESVIRKIKYIKEMWGVDATLLTVNYNPLLPLLEFGFTGEWLQANQTQLPADNTVFGVFDYFQNCYPYNRTLEMIERFKPEESQYQYQEVSPNVYDVFDDGTKLRREFYTYPRNLLQLIQTFDADGKVEKTYQYDRLGYLSRLSVHDKEQAGFCPIEYYFDIDRKLRIKAEYVYIEKPEESKRFSNKIHKNKNELVKYTVYSDTGETEAHSHEDLITLCLDGLTSDPDKVYFICDECAQFSGGATRLNKKNIANAAVVHNKFLDDSNNLKSNPQMFYQYLCENRRLYDGIVLLTKDETKDFTKKFEPSRRLFTIFHPYPFAVNPAPFEERNHKRCISVGRLDPFKRLDLMVEIFAMVLKDVPDATLDIYGFGGEEQKLKDKIAELNVGESVKLCGFTAKAAEELSKSACFLMTSNVEGFPLTLSEALCNGAPIFAFDIKYGPQEIVRNGVTGFLFKDKDKRRYTAQLVKFLQDEDLQRRVSDSCYIEAPKFSVEAFMEKWGGFTEAMYHKAKRRMESNLTILEG